MISNCFGCWVHLERALALLLLGALLPPYSAGAAVPVGPIGMRAQASGPQERTAEAPKQESDDVWAHIWDDVRSLRYAHLVSEERVRLRSSLERRLQEQTQRGGDAVRIRLLSSLLARMDDPQSKGVEPADLNLKGPSWRGTLSSSELWAAAEVLAPGPARVQAVLLALHAAPIQSDQLSARARLKLAWSIGTTEARNGRLAEGALPIQRELHELYPASWSSTDLALTLALLSHTDEADAVLRAEIRRESESQDGNGRVDPELWNRRGLIALGIRHERRSRDYLGRAIRLGSTNARVVTGRLELSHGNLEEARRIFLSLSWSPDPGAWSQRGFGLALLTPRPTGALPPRETRSHVGTQKSH